MRYLPVHSPVALSLKIAISILLILVSADSLEAQALFAGHSVSPETVRYTAESSLAEPKDQATFASQSNPVLQWETHCSPSLLFESGPCNSATDRTSYPTVSLTGLIQAEAIWFSQEEASLQSVGDIDDVTSFRRARLGGVGNVTDNVSYLLELDFGFPGRPTFMDLFVDLESSSGIHYRFGQWRQPFGMDALTGIKSIWFLERALPFAFLPFRQTGLGAYSTAFDESMTWAVSGYRYPVDPFGGLAGDSGYGMSTRLTWNAVYDESSQQVVHFGAAYSINNPANDQIRLRTPPEVGFTFGDFNTTSTPVPFFVDTGPIASSTLSLIGAEAAASWGPLALQSELIYAMVDLLSGGSVWFPGLYVQASYVLTGESHTYNRNQGVFRRVSPEHNWGQDGCGAWEIAGRWSYISLNDGTINGGQLQDLTFGINWYLNAYTRFEFNYIHAMLEDSAGLNSGTDILGVRAEVAF